MKQHIRPLALFGPTASGKTALAIELARTLNGVVINADSLQVYRDCPILTAQPNAEEKSAADHRLYGFLPAHEPMDAARWLNLAIAEIKKVQREGKRPLICGGTGFYLKALEEGLCHIPPISSQVKAAADAHLHNIGLEAFEAEVFKADPNLQGRFERGDRQRLLRAWCVCQDTGRPLSHWYAQPKRGGLGLLHTFTLLPHRPNLYLRIDQRLNHMLAQNAGGEVAGLAQRARALGLNPLDLPLAQALGFQELLAVHEGDLTLATAQDQISQASRRYAKRQLTWARNQLKKAIKLPISLINEHEMKSICATIISFMRFLH